MLNKALSYSLGLAVGLLAVAPPLTYNIPLIVNSYSWLYCVVVAMLLGGVLLTTKLPWQLKVLVAYLTYGCFISWVPYLSFNAMILVVIAAYGFLGFMQAKPKIVADVVIAAFAVQMYFTVMQLCGRDTLMNFDRREVVFLGTVMQYMRFSSLLAIMAPFLLWRSRMFIFPLMALVILSKSSSFALSIIAWAAVYAVTEYRIRVWKIGLISLFFGVLYLLWDNGSFITEISVGRLTVWPDIIRTWIMDTTHQFVLPLRGPIDIPSIFLGRGMDTFMPLFPIFKHDPNPFAQAHNCHLQLLWEIGLCGYGLLAWYMMSLWKRLRSNPVLLAGLACVLVNMFFAFPTRMTQTMFLLVAFLGLCEGVARREDGDFYAC